MAPYFSIMIFSSLLQYSLNPEARDAKQTKSTIQYDSNYYGENIEKKVFLRLKNWSEQSKIENFTIFSGWKDNGKFEKNDQREFDFIIVSGNAKLVIFIEVKTTNNENNTQLKKAKSQLEKGYHFLRGKVPFSQGWRFVSVIYIEHDAANTNNDFILGPKSNISRFFESKLELGKCSSSSMDYVSYKVHCIDIYFYIITFSTYMLYVVQNVSEYLGCKLFLIIRP